jgi:multicomponent Na+:H+ antiporter subunit G
MLKLVLVWLLVLVAGAAACHLVAQRVWTRSDGEEEV